MRQGCRIHAPFRTQTCCTGLRRDDRRDSDRQRPTVYTLNPGYFAGIDALQVVPIPHPEGEALSTDAPNERWAGRVTSDKVSYVCADPAPD